MAVAVVNGLQGKKDAQGYIDFSSRIISTAKHFAAYGKTQGTRETRPPVKKSFRR
jgi:beta-glucosidase-like glycosyl hydrolase